MNVRSLLSGHPGVAALGAAIALPLAACAQDPYYNAPGAVYQQPAYGYPTQPAYQQPVYQQQPAYQQPVYQQEYAHVLSVRPVTRAVQTRQQVCTPVAYAPPPPPQPTYGGYNGADIAGGLLGAVAGGVIGHQIGGGRGQSIATAAGAVLGAGVGANIANNVQNGAYATNSPYYGQPAPGYGAYGAQGQQCHEQPGGVVEQADGYDVTYRYRGQVYQTRLPYDPGPRLAVQANGAVMSR